MGSKSTCGSFKIPTGLQKLHLQKHMKLKDLLYLYVLEEKGPAPQEGDQRGRAPRDWAQPSTWGAQRERESEDPWASAFIGDQEGVHSKW